MKTARTVLAVAALSMIWLAGCGGGGTAFVVHRPDWPYAKYERLAVLPGQASDPHAAREAELLSDRLTSLLASNGTFTIVSRAELADVFKEQDLSQLANAIDEGTALPEGRLEIAQALVATRITDYKLIRERVQKSVPVPRFNSRGKLIGFGQKTVWMHRHGAEVEGSVRVVDAATGRILVSHTARIIPPACEAQNRSPSESPEDLAAAAVRELAVECCLQVAPMRIEVKFDKDSLLVATGFFDGKYDEEKKLARGLGEFMLVVVDLSEACDRNDFKVGVSAEDGRVNLYESDAFTWSSSSGRQGMSFTVPMDALSSAGSNKFVAKLYSVGNPEPVITRPFELVE